VANTDCHKEETMDVLPIFPMLLLFMVAALLALGYALRRIERGASGGLNLSQGACDRCGLPLDIGWRHCPSCGAAIELVPRVARTAERDDAPRPLEAGHRS